MLTTPLGDIEIYIDDKKIEYGERNIRISDKLCPDIDGRYSIEVNFIPDGKIHAISCRIKDYISSKEDGIESGERLELKSFYRDNTKLSIGMEGDAGYYPDGTRDQMCMIATIMGLDRAIRCGNQSVDSVYNHRGILFI